MSDLLVWITIIGLTGVTFLTRAGFLLLPQRYQLPPGLQRALRYAPACALIAIIVPDIAFVRSSAHAGDLDINPANVRLISAVIGGLLYYKTRDMLKTIILGMIVFTVLRLAVGG